MALLDGTSLEVEDRPRVQLDPVVELPEQPRLAHTGIADDGHHSSRRRIGDDVERSAQPCEFGVTSDHPRLDTLDTTRRSPEGTGLDRSHEIQGQ